MVFNTITEYLGSDAMPVVGTIVGAGVVSAITGYLLDALKWTGTDKAAWASVAFKIAIGAVLFQYASGISDTSSTTYILARGAAMGSLAAIGITLWNRFAPFQLQVSADSSLLSANPTSIGQRRALTMPVTVSSGCSGTPDSGTRVSAIGQKR